MNPFRNLGSGRGKPLDSGYLSKGELKRIPFASVGNNVRIARNSTVIGAENITLGNNVRIDGFCTVIAAGGALSIGNNVHIGGGCHVNASAGVVIDSFSTLSQGVRVYSASDDFSGAAMTNSTVPGAYKNVKCSPVRLGRHVVIGSGSVVLPGSTLEDGVAVGALSLVNRDLAGWKIYAGAPVRELSNRQTGALELEKKFLESQGLD